MHWQSMHGIPTLLACIRESIKNLCAEMRSKVISAHPAGVLFPLTAARVWKSLFNYVKESENRVYFRQPRWAQKDRTKHGGAEKMEREWRTERMGSMNVEKVRC